MRTLILSATVLLLAVCAGRVASAASEHEHKHEAAPGTHEAILKISHEVDQFLHMYHQKLESRVDLRHYDKDFVEVVHRLDEAVHAFHEFAKKATYTMQEELQEFKKCERLYREARALFLYLAHEVHSDKAAGLGWKDFERKWEELHQAVTGHFSWQDAEFDTHAHEHGHEH